MKSQQLLLRSFTETEESLAKYKKDFEAYAEKRKFYILKEHLKKLFILLNCFGIEENDDSSKWLLLSYALAMEYVPGFSVNEKSKRGAPRKWDELLHARLYKDVRALMLRKESGGRKISKSNACTIIAKKEPWKTIMGVQEPKTLYNEFLKAEKSKLVLLMNELQERIGIDWWQHFYPDEKDI